MSLWKWNNVELEIDMADYDFLQKYHAAFENLAIKEEKLQKTGTQLSIIKEYCQMFYTLFDDIFGEGTGEKLFVGKKNMRICEECYESFIECCTKEVAEVNKLRNTMLKKYNPKSKR